MIKRELAVIKDGKVTNICDTCEKAINAIMRNVELTLKQRSITEHTIINLKCDYSITPIMVDIDTETEIDI